MSVNEQRSRIRSFVRRGARMTQSQRNAFATQMERYGIVVTDQAVVDFDALFGRRAPRVVEIGFGEGDSLVAMAAADADRDYIGIEVYHAGVGRLLRQIELLGLSNLRVVHADAVDVLRNNIPDASLDALFLFFSDPWPKKRHHKRRLVQRDFVTLVGQKLKPAGVFHMATDWEGYAMQMMNVMSAEPAFSNQAGPGNFSKRPEYRPKTKFERRGQRLGHDVWDLIFVRGEATDG
ncbi:MAG: tRNA (guanosine(46)-N7)-methyltransferase TrmB [Gammaproteobacteria bacterium]|nr:tRNA (guanosine(46)-N7)-methyltransferase TrmB [Gammaproteobacteria bacterium]